MEQCFHYNLGRSFFDCFYWDNCYNDPDCNKDIVKNSSKNVLTIKPPFLYNYKTKFTSF